MIAYAHDSRCPSCGREVNDAEARFCAGCGGTLDLDPAPGRPILSAVDADDPQDARTRLGVERVAPLGRSTISPGASLRAVGQTRTRRSQRVGRPTHAAHNEYEKHPAPKDEPVMLRRSDPDLDLVASRGLDASLAPEPEPFPPRDAHFDGNPFFDDVFQGEPKHLHGGHSAARRREPDVPPPGDAPAVDLDVDLDLDLDVLDIAAIQRARRTRAVVGVAVALTAIGVSLVLAL